MPLNLVQTLSELVAIPSVNPMGRPVSGPEYFEHRVTDYLERLFERLGLAWERQTVHPGRDNILARLDGDVPAEKGGPLLLFEAHQDTVPVDGMTIDPWEPVVRNGRLYGRGSCDIKGGMTAMLGALTRLAEERPRGRPTVVMACTINEEHGYTGATALAQLWSRGESDDGRDPARQALSPGLARLLPRRPDAAIVAEPTELDVVVAHKGALRWKCHTLGRAAHSSQPQMGENALYKMARVLLALEAHQREVVPTLRAHPRCGRPSLSVGTIAGGLSVNTVPDRATIEIDRRMIPGEQWEGVFDEIKRFLASRPEIDFEIVHDDPYMKGSTLSDEENQPIAERLLAVAREVVGRGELVGVPYGTDASTIAAHGVPAVVFGPGSIDQAHTCDEWLPLEQLELASETLYRLAARYSSTSG